MRRLIAFVILFHFGALGLFALFSHRAPHKAPPPKLMVHTRSSPLPTQTRSAPAPTPVAHVEPVEPIEAAPPHPLPKPSQAPKPSTTTKPLKKVQAKPAQKVSKGGSPPKNSDLLAKMQKSLSSLDQARTLLQSTPAPTFELGWSYEEQLTTFLKTSLLLPERGDVRIELTLSSQGKVEQLSLLSWASEKNRAYVEVTLRKLVFPAFTQDLRKEKRHTFSLTLTND